MIIFPVIELKEGFARRIPTNDIASAPALVRSDESIYDEDPAVVAQHWVAQGAEWLHIGNLDGTISANNAHFNALYRSPNIRVQQPGSDRPESGHEELRRTVPTNLLRLSEIQKIVQVPIQFSGGIETLDDIQLAFEYGADRVVLDVDAVAERSMILEAVERWGPERIVVSIDATDSGGVGDRNGDAQARVIDVGHQIQAMGVRHVIFADYSRNGRLQGVNAGAAAALGEISDLHIIVRGGVAGLQDIEQLKALEHHSIEGVLSNRAIYSGSMDLNSAIEIGHRPLEQFSAGVIPIRRAKTGIQFLLLYNWYYEVWEFPRGPLEMKETTAESARRSFQELTGLQIRRFYEGCNPRLNYTVTIREYEVQHTIIYYLVEVEDGEVQIGDENHCEEHWGDYQSVWALLTETAPEQLPALDRAMDWLEQELD